MYLTNHRYVHHKPLICTPQTIDTYPTNHRYVCTPLTIDTYPTNHRYVHHKPLICTLQTIDTYPTNLRYVCTPQTIISPFPSNTFSCLDNKIMAIGMQVARGGWQFNCQWKKHFLCILCTWFTWWIWCTLLCVSCSAFSVQTEPLQH